MGTEEGGDQTDRLLISQLTVDPKKLELGFLVQSVPTLAFDGGHPEREHFFEEAAGACQQLRLGGVSSLPHRRQNSAAGPGDLQVGAALDPLHELVGSPAGKSEVRVAIDQPRENPDTFGADTLG